MCCCYGLGAEMKRLWTPAEDEILRSFWKTNLPAVDIAHRLPGRTDAAIRRRAHWIGCATRGPGPKPVIEKSVMAMIRKDGPICAAEMARRLLCATQQVDQYLRRLRKANRIHISGHVERHENHVSRLWSAGKGTDAKRPIKSERPAWVEIAPAKPTFASDPLMAALYHSARRVSSPAGRAA